MKTKILIYGAAGYMGRLFTKYAKTAQLPIVLGSREVFETSEVLRIFSLDDINEIAKQLADIKLVVNLAGPFLYTQQPLIEACLATQTHYIDIAGEYLEFSSVAGRFHKRASEAGIMLMPGAGFGVVPTDIAAKMVVQQLPDASHLAIAYITEGGASRGTLKTVLKDINRAGIQIVEGQAVKAMPAQSAFSFEASGKKHRVVYNPWRGDLFTAQLSTGVLNISTYAGFPRFVEGMMKGKLLWLRDLILKRLIRFLPLGPSKKELQKGKTIVYTEATNPQGQKARVMFEGPEAYLFTAQMLVSITQKIGAGDWQAGFQTPSIYGEDLLKPHVRYLTQT